MKQTIGLLTKYFGEGIEVQTGLRDETFILLKDASRIKEAMELLRDNGFSMLIDLTAVHYPGREKQFELVYNMLAMEPLLRLLLKVPLEGEYPEVDSVSSVFKTANWYEREVFDMFGIRFKDHPNLKRILMWEDYEGHPLRKEFPLEGDNLHCYD
ncbi:MAG: NADH-quinone oxidoreductase subunit C [Acidobacteria bacterium]|nr:NADH-quinone oxidoreductase subunit C [Acidobacteriota bacterium]